MKKSNERIRQEYLCDVLNAAVNLYGVVVYEDAMNVYARYAKGKQSFLAAALTVEEIDAMLGWDTEEDCGKPPLADALGKERCFVGFEMHDALLLVHDDIFDGCWDADGTLDPEKGMTALQDWFCNAKLSLRMIALDEEKFLAYADPDYYESTIESKRLLDYIHNEYDVSLVDAERAVRFTVHHLMRNPDPNDAVLYACLVAGIAIDCEADYDDLMDVILPLARVVRVWKFGGFTDQELVRDGYCDDFNVKNDEKAKRAFMEERAREGRRLSAAGASSEDDDWAADDDDPELLSDDELEKALPSPDYPQHPVDFKFVKDAKKREAALRDYRLLREETQRFVRDVMMPKLTPEARKAAAKRLGFASSGDVAFLIGTLDMVAGDFGSMLDDQDGEPLRRQVLADVSKLSKRDQLMARYYANYRYSWLVVEAAKAGVGVKCRNLMTGEELFLMEINLSQAPDVKGLTICAGIAPMGDVYLSLGTPHIARFEPSDAVHRLVRQKLGFPLEGRLDLSDADQARFAAETIHRIYDVGGFNRIVYGR